MPGISGLDVCAELKRSDETRLTPVVRSAASGSGRRARGLEAGADDFLNKPIDPEELQTRVRSLMRLQAPHRRSRFAASLFLTLGRIIERATPAPRALQRLTDYATALGALDLGRTISRRSTAARFFTTSARSRFPIGCCSSGKLTRKEYDLMKRHPAIGGRSVPHGALSFEAVRPDRAAPSRAPRRPRLSRRPRRRSHSPAPQNRQHRRRVRR